MVSVIIPNYNHAPYLHQRIESVLNQTYQNFEIILLDDCSTDSSATILKQYAGHPKVAHIILNAQNSGSTFKQWRKGIALAKGDWIWIAESDDFCMPNLLETLIDGAQRCANAVLSFCQSYTVDEAGAILNDMRFHTDAVNTEHWKADYCGDGETEIKDYLLYLNTIPNASGVLFKRLPYEASAVDFEQMRMCGDWMLWVELLKQGNIAYSAKPLNRFRTHAYTTRVLDSGLKLRKRIEEEYLVAKHIQATTRFGNELIVKARLRQICRNYSRNFSRSEIYKTLLTPLSYRSAIPYSKLWLGYVQNKLQRFL